MNTSLQDSLDLPPVDQVGFVVADIDAAVKQYEPMFGPFERMDPGPYTYTYRGKREQADLRLAFGKSGDIEIELIQWLSGGSPHKEFRDAGREGMHHLRFIVDSVPDMVAAAEPFGYRPIWETEFAPGLAVAYLERNGDPLLIEFYQNEGFADFDGEQK